MSKPETPELGSKRMSEEVESLSAKLHDIYMIEANRQEKELGRPIRHDWDYEKLSEPTKEYDRVLARFILDREKHLDEEILRLNGEVEFLATSVYKEAVAEGIHDKLNDLEVKNLELCSSALVMEDALKRLADLDYVDYDHATQISKEALKKAGGV